jgi:hypothetical protein
MPLRSIVHITFAACTLAASVSLAAGHGHGKFKAACGDDVQKVCSDTAHGKATFDCLKSHRDQLSETCKTFLDNHRAHEQEEKPAPAPQ